MSPAPLTRRALVRTAGVALGAGALPAGITAALAAATPPTGLPAALPPAFDPGAFVDDLLDAGCRVLLIRDEAHSFNPHPRPPHVCIIPPGGRWSAASYGAVMARWTDAMDACPDHAERLVAHMAQRTTPGA